MLKYIIYKSRTGFAKRYAQALSQKLRIPFISMDEAQLSVNSTVPVFFIAGMRNGRIYSLKKARNIFKVEAAAAVGIQFPSEKIVENLKKHNNMYDIPIFYLHGGSNLELLSLKDKILFKLFFQRKFVKNKKETGIDYFNEDNLEPINDWFNSYLIYQDILNKAYKSKSI